MYCFSLVLATYGRTETLCRLFDSLCAQTFKDFEVIICDQNEKDLLYPIISKYKELKIMHLRTSKGLSVSRNCGLKVATGKYITFPDDDCWYPENLLEKVFSVFNRNEEIALYSGQYGEPEIRNNKFPQFKGEITRWNIFKSVSSITIFFRRKYLDKVGLFDPSLGVGAKYKASEEIDFVLRFLKNNLGCQYDPEIIVYHKVKRESNSDIRSICERETANSLVVIRCFLDTFDLRLFLRLVLKFCYLSLLCPFGGVARFRFVSFLKAFKEYWLWERKKS